jgi:hypothetical protein
MKKHLQTDRTSSSLYFVRSGERYFSRRSIVAPGDRFPADKLCIMIRVSTLGFYAQFVGGNKASLEGVNEYRLEAYATLLFGASSDRARSCGKTITADPPRRRDGLK